MTKYFRTLFLTGLHGQYKVWRKDIAPTCNKVDKIIQFGNLIGCNDFSKDKETLGPNAAVLKFTALYRSTQDNWIQLAGTNEIAALNSPTEWTNSDSRKILRDSWFSDDPQMIVAAVDKNRLVTHGGLTHGEWLSLGSPTTAEDTAYLLNEKYVGTLYQGPSLKLGSPPNYSANPIWADPVREVYGSWIVTPTEMPFDQIHGAESLYLKDNRSLLRNKESILSYVDHVSFESHKSTVTIKGSTFTGIDLDLNGDILTAMPQPKRLYIEKIEA